MNKSLSLNVKKWYTETFPTDEMGQELKDDITFSKVLICMNFSEDDIYDLLGVGDSVIRERVCEELSFILNN